VRGTRPLTMTITVPRGTLPYLLNLRIPSPATWAPVQIKLGGRNR
jgi:hypothetical protein